MHAPVSCDSCQSTKFRGKDGITICVCWVSNQVNSGNITIVNYWPRGYNNLYTSKEVHTLGMHDSTSNALSLPHYYPITLILNGK